MEIGPGPYSHCETYKRPKHSESVTRRCGCRLYDPAFSEEAFEAVRMIVYIRILNSIQRRSRSVQSTIAESYCLAVRNGRCAVS